MSVPPPKTAVEEAQGWQEVFFFKQTPQWYLETCQMTLYGFVFTVTKTVLNWKDVQVVLPPRAYTVLTPEMRQGYINTRRLRAAFLKSSRETCFFAFVSALYFSSSFYLGVFMGRHDPADFAVGGALAGVLACKLFVGSLRPRAAVLGALGGAVVAYTSNLVKVEAGQPLWTGPTEFLSYSEDRARRAKEREEHIVTFQHRQQLNSWFNTHCEVQGVGALPDFLEHAQDLDPELEKVAEADQEVGRQLAVLRAVREWRDKWTGSYDALIL